MTGDQGRTASLAQSVCDGRLRAEDVSDADWALLLRAAGLHNVHSLPLIVCHRVLNRVRRGIGYFAAPAPGPVARWADLRATINGRA